MGDFILRVVDLGVVLQGQVVLEGISFDLERGTTLSLVGPNGAGKTVLFRALLNLVPYTGRVEWASGVKVGYVPQMVSVRDVPISVREFLTMRRGTTPEAALDLVGLDEHILKKGLSVLSGGQLRRVLIAWAVMDRPDMLLFDEPTTGVDLDSEEAIYDMLKGLTRNVGITTILISHERHIVRDYSDKMLAVDGCVKFYGDSKMIMDPEVQRLIYTERHACRPIVPLGEVDG